MVVSATMPPTVSATPSGNMSHCNVRKLAHSLKKIKPLRVPPPIQKACKPP